MSRSMTPPKLPRGHRMLSWIVAVLIAVGFGACVAKGANGPADPTLSSFPDFGKVGIEVFAIDDGSLIAARCALLAKTEDQHQRGLMFVRNLSGFAGMVFEFDVVQPVTSHFYMKNTPMPLTVVFYDSAGRFISSADMAPCLENTDSCPEFASERPYKTALEVPQGEAARLGIVATTALRVKSTCPRQ